MADVASVEVSGLQELIVRLQGEADGGMMRRVSDAVSWETKQLEAQVKQNIQNLFQTPDRMLASISSEVEVGRGEVTGSVTASGLPYLKIQEFGGTVQTPEIVPVNAKVLAFMSSHKLQFGGLGNPQSTDMIFTKKTRAHPTDIPERSFMRRSLAERKADIITSIQLAARIP